MSSLVLQPINDNIIDTFINDKIDRNADVLAFVEMLNTIDENYSIALDGKWGSGKTFFVKHVIKVIETLNKDIIDNDIGCAILKAPKQSLVTLKDNKITPIDVNNNKNFAIYFDAWENDNDDDPLLSILYTIISSSRAKLSNESNLLDVFSNIAEMFKISPIVAFLDTIKSVKGTNILDELVTEKEKREKVNSFFESLAAICGNNRVVIFIDELDRCKPSYAVKLLERIKHYMTYKNITFVFSTNMAELSHTIKKCYGEGFDGYKYLEKFFDFRYELPKLTFAQQANINNFNPNSTHDRVVQAFIERYNIPLRDSIKLHMVVKHFTTLSINKYGNKITPNDSYYEPFCIYYLVPFMICLKYHSYDMYNSFISGKQNYMFYNDNLSEIFGWLYFDNEQIGDKAMTVSRLNELYDKIFNQNLDIMDKNSSGDIFGKFIIPYGAKEQLLQEINLK